MIGQLNLIVYAFCSAVQGADSRYLLRYNFTEGQVRRYSYELTLAVGVGANASDYMLATKANSIIRMATKRVMKDKSATVSSLVEKCFMTFNGQPYPVGSQGIGQVFYSHLSSRGVVLSKVLGHGHGVLPDILAGPDEFSAAGVLPAKPVKVGDTWHVIARNGSEFTSKLMDVRDGIATIRTDGNARLNPTALGKLFTSAKMNVSVSTRLHILWTLDLKTGTQINLSLTGRLLMHMRTLQPDKIHTEVTVSGPTTGKMELVK